MKSFWVFLIFRLTLLAPLSVFMACKRTPEVSAGLDHDFASGQEEGLYKVEDIVPHKADTKTAEVTSPPPADLRTRDDKVQWGKEFHSKGILGANISNLNSLLKIRTGSKGERPKISSAQNIFIDPKISFINEYELLGYTILPQKTEWQKKIAKLLGPRVDKFKGFPDTEYYILPHFEGNFLILYKVAAPDKIAYVERPLAKTIGGMLAIPLVGYPIRYCKAVNIPGPQNEKTLLYRPLCEGVLPAEAEYVHLQANERREFEYLPKRDLFPRDFFNGQWFYVRTAVRSFQMGLSNKRSDKKVSFQSAHLVEFHPLPEKLDVLDSEEYQLRPDDKIRTLFIPVQWTDYEINGDSENIDLSFSERPIQSVYDRSLRYFQMKFEQLIANDIEFSGKKNLQSVYITNDYISFDIEITAKGESAHLLKYAFRRIKDTSDYKEKQWFESDSILFFPAFAIKRRYYKDLTDHTKTDNDRFFRTTRFNPLQGEIQWYFSKQTSSEQWLRDFGVQAVAWLNRAFKEAGKASDYPIKVILNDSKQEAKELGDIRYNILNLMLSEGDTENQFSWGPNVAHPLTGEVISATANVWVNKILSKYIRIVRRYVRFHVYPPAWKIAPDQPGVTAFLHEKIQNEKACKRVREFIEKNKNSVFHLSNPVLQDKDFVSFCARALARPKIMQSVLQNMLHSFGQRLVLSASADRENFYKSYSDIEKVFGEDVFAKTSKEHPHPPRYSSVMDEMDWEYPILTVPGKLDIAALRFIYFNQVELDTEIKEEDSKGLIRGQDARYFLKVPASANQEPEPPQKSILETAQTLGFSKEDLKIYKVCGGKKKRKGDGNIDRSFEEPLCAEWDYGISPVEVIKNSIYKFNNYLMAGRNRYDSEGISHRVEKFDFLNQAPRLYAKWEYYRDRLLEKHGKFLYDYSFFDSAHVAEYKALLQQEAKKEPEFKAYFKSSRLIFEYFLKMAFLPLKHCVYKNTEGNFSAVALEKIEGKITSDYSETGKREEFINCRSPVVMKWAKDNNKGTLVTEMGFFRGNRIYFLWPRDGDPMDEMSVFQFPWAFLHRYFTGILQDPEFASLYYEELKNYAFQGIDLNPYIDFSKNPDIPRDGEGRPVLPRVLGYQEEGKLLRFLNNESTVFQIRLDFMHSQMVALEKKSTNKDVLEQLNIHYRSHPLPFSQLSEYMKSIEQNPNLYKNHYPFLVQLYEEYRKKKSEGELEKEDSFVVFLKNQPSVLYDETKTSFFLPFRDDDSSFIVQTFRKFNEYYQCIQADDKEENVCEDRDEKEVFIQIVFSIY